jgi:hypothetical protein
MYPTIKYVAELKHVREVSLVGTADLAFWKDRLRPAGLQPTEIGGGAQSMIGGIESRFLGVAFRGATISVFLSRHRGGSGRDGVFLARAFKPSRFFAFVERACFSSPYLHGQLRIDARRPASIEVARDDGIALIARMADSPGRSPSRGGDEDWRGPVFLPSGRRQGAGACKPFPARVSGAACTCPFSPSEDPVTIRPSRDGTALRSLVESNFAGREWVLRADGSHAKGKTVARGPADAAFDRQG